MYLLGGERGGPGGGWTRRPSEALRSARAWLLYSMVPFDQSFWGSLHSPAGATSYKAQILSCKLKGKS